MSEASKPAGASPAGDEGKVVGHAWPALASEPPPAGDEVPVDVAVTIDEEKMTAAIERVRADLETRVTELTEPVREMVARAYHAGVADGQRATAAAAK